MTEITDSAGSAPTPALDVYLVGGAVRDTLLGRPVSERDYVVVGATPEIMRAAGYRQVGREFPVFLHPQTGEEYALARTERNTAPGYRGFQVYSAPDVTLEDDLRRRDLTINAIAQAPDGTLIDPYGGQRDLQRRLLRHVSAAFAEDPVRILRLARFAARYHPLGFVVAPETLALMRRMVEAGEVDALVPERVWAETARALMEDSPQVFFTTLRDCGALARLFPALDRSFGVLQPVWPDPDGNGSGNATTLDSGDHTLLTLRLAAGRGAELPVRFALLTQASGEVSHPAAGAEGDEAAVRALAGRLRVPNDCRELALLLTRHRTRCHRALTLDPPALLALLQALDALRRPARFEQLLLACELDACARGAARQPGGPCTYPQAAWLRAAAAAAAIDVQPLLRQGLRDGALADALRQRRIDAISRLTPARPA